MRNFPVYCFLRVLILRKSRIISGAKHAVHGESKTSLYKILVRLLATIWKSEVSGASVAARRVADCKGRKNEYFV